MKTPSQFTGKKYLNTLPTGMSMDYGQMLRRWLRGTEEREPKTPLGPFRADVAALAEPVPAAALRVTWFGHSSTLIELDGKRFLTDPVWRLRASPLSVVGPKRFFAPPLALTELPPLDAVILSHDHYDHLDKDAIRTLSRTGVPFFCPLGVGGHLRRWGVPAAQITELDWWQEVTLGAAHTLVATPARHFSGRRLTRDNTFWASWCLLGPTHRAFFGGDSGPYEAAFREIGAAYGPFDLVMLEVGAYDALWADIHMGPDHALAAHRALGGGPLLPLHWATFNLAFHAWTEPVERLLAAAGPDVPLLLPAPGQRVEVAAGPLPEQWWRR
ncbi:MBL fold metallo-hydrolase [Hymenobacter chitinivorans]|uniref:L-ascorbate metabolism protein UlaG (Beta-lactamase superfamily) n=1 Tax=Hymenobacter chitinivorans DSM 11115 TaxID=1121954 RepID=A0A2M9BAK5_9BACT|nr:MBL fold metallo-hydrolase [Hymenobacter chitinivorans]PJJ54965.1 L-ascorbate metabolism protein UlaG (beta-lactamase superfamily) [Hymenobacter chitinivorans DSM 11115]